VKIDHSSSNGVSTKIIQNTRSITVKEVHSELLSSIGLSGGKETGHKEKERGKKDPQESKA
jgi:hypothetical protein